MARVLHIEDDARNRLLVQKLLGAAGHQVVDAETGLLGIQLAREQRPDLVLVDINVPDLDGYEVTLRLRGMPSLSGVPIVVITAEGERETSLAVGADGFIGKPIDARRFAKTVERFLRGHRERGDDTAQIRLRERSQKIVERLEGKVVALSEANARLEEMARLRREYIQNVSHELATPMTPVVGYLQLLLAEELGPLTPMQKKCLSAIETSTARLRSVVDSLLDLSALETGRMFFQARDYDFTEVVRRAAEEARAGSDDAGPRWLEEPSAGACPARGDPDKLRRAVVHVLDNALKFTPVTGVIAIGVRENTAGYELVVADSGPGVHPSQRTKIFEPFYQVDGSTTRSHGGVGLGLAFANHVCTAHGGRLSVESPPRERVAGQTLPGTLVRFRVARLPQLRRESALP